MNEDQKKKVLERAPLPVPVTPLIRVNIHPNQYGNWVWHASKSGQGHDVELMEFLNTVGKDLVTTYCGGAVMAITHALRLMTDEEVKELDEDVLAMADMI